MVQATSGGPYAYASQGRQPDDGARATGESFDRPSDVTAEASERVEQAIHVATDAARQVAAQGREAGERVQVVAENFRTAVDKSVREQPMATLAVAAALGFVLGALWKS